ncbi:hypothetical protein J4217_03855 [Candidatus Pacearchaeota archaeon]|nr:hypothetical protein [uncultured archaeon]AQS33225.1 hypothetical protein [uncultured archaeon]MBS3091554.1 hypothetical protein [Candidatus Pacearchaeota archaeon]
MALLELKIDKLEHEKFSELIMYLDKSRYPKGKNSNLLPYIKLKGIDKVSGVPPVYEGVRLEYNSGMPNKILQGLMHLL